MPYGTSQVKYLIGVMTNVLISRRGTEGRLWGRLNYVLMCLFLIKIRVYSACERDPGTEPQFKS